MKKTVTPVSLATKKAQQGDGHFWKGHKSDKLSLTSGLDDSYYPQHLYLTTPAMLLDINAGDWYIDDTDAIREAVVSDKDYWARRPSYRKIIAATDKSLRQPIIHPDFVKYFVEKQGKVGKCEVDYQEFTQYSASIKANGEGASNTIVGCSVIKLTNGYVAVIVD